MADDDGVEEKESTTPPFVLESPSHSHLQLMDLGVDDRSTSGSEYGSEMLPDEEEILDLVGGSGSELLQSLGIRYGEEVRLTWIRQTDGDFADAVVRYLEHSDRNLQPILPNPTGHIDSEFQEKFGIDLSDWLGECRKRNDSDDATGGNIDAKTPAKGKMMKRGPYKCRVCGERQIKNDKNPHDCRPTKDQVVEEVLRQLSGAKKQKVVSGNPNKRGPYACGSCGSLKVGCTCPGEYGRIANIVREHSAYDSSNPQEIRDLVGRTIDKAHGFRFSNDDGRRTPVNLDENIRDTFQNDHAPADAGLFPLPPQAIDHIELLRQGASPSQTEHKGSGDPSEHVVDL